MSKLNIDFLDKFQILRKYKLSLILIAPNEKYVDSAGLGSDVLDCVIIKPDFKNPKIALYEDVLELNSSRFNNIPATQIKFDTWDIAPFRAKRPLSKMSFSDPELQILYQLGQGAKYSDIAEHPQKINRIVRKFARIYTEKITSQVT